MEGDMKYSKRTYVYKSVQDCQIQADVYQLQSDDQRPAILWMHGGGLIFGNRNSIPPEQIELYLKAGFTVISIDHRLAPETKLEMILEDVQDAYYWVKNQGPGLFNIDPDCIAVIGHSAGGYLTLMTGFSVHPRPKALISFYGYGDIVGEWCSSPDPHYNKEPIVSEKMARQGVTGAVITGSQFAGPSDKRWLFYLFCRQQGLWPIEVAGHNPKTESQAFEQFCPIQNVTREYPPTLLLHGEKDTDVPFELSKQMAAALKKHHIPHQLIMMEGMGHKFDVFPEGFPEGKPIGLQHPKVAEAFDIVLAFLKEQIGR